MKQLRLFSRPGKERIGINRRLALVVGTPISEDSNNGNQRLVSQGVCG